MPLILNRMAISITETTYSVGAPGAGEMVIFIFLEEALALRLSVLSRSPIEILRPLKKYSPLLLMVTLSILSVDTLLVLELPGNLRFKAFGATKLEVSIKNISSKKIMSVKDDILNCALTLFLFFSPTTFILGSRVHVFTCSGFLTR